MIYAIGIGEKGENGDIFEEIGFDIFLIFHGIEGTDNYPRLQCNPY